MGDTPTWFTLAPLVSAFLAINVIVGEEPVVLVKLGLVEQRYRAVLEVLEGATVVDVARRYGVVRQTVHDWLRRYATGGGLGGLADRSSRPDSCPHQMPARVEAAIVTLRKAHPAWGPDRIVWQLGRDGVAPLPSRSSVYRALTRHGLVQSRPRRRKREDYRRWERDRSMELWQMDVMGRVFLADGTELKLVTGLDDHSRFVVCARLVPRATATSVCRALLQALATHGVPRQLLTDNGSVFTTRFTGGVGGALFDRICTQHGIQHLLTAPYSPTTTGKVERLHKTIRAEFLSEHDRRHSTLESLQEALDGWVQQYNTARPHQSCGNQPPAARFVLAPPAKVMPLEQMLQGEEPVFTAAGAVNRKVDAKGRVALRGYDYPVGRVFTGEVVQLLLADGLLQVFHRGVLIASCVHRGERPTRPTVPKGKPEPSTKKPVPIPAGPRDRSGPTVTRHVDGNGEFGFAGRNYTAGKALAGTAVQVAVVGQQVHVSQHGALVRVHPIRHDRAKEFGAFARPNGIARKHAG